MYHELGLPGRDPLLTTKAYTRYVVSAERFGQQLVWLKENGFLGIDVTQALQQKNLENEAVVLTFDDGCETDLVVAAPLIHEKGFRATFYVVAGFIGQAGYLSSTQIRQLAQMGFEVGCHSMSHAYLPGLGQEQLHCEIAEAKDRLEQLTGRSVHHFSCPGGRWSRRVAAVAKETGYRSVATSRIGRNSANTDVFKLARIAVMRETSLEEFTGMVRGTKLLQYRLKSGALQTAKQVLGNKAYERVRSFLLERNQIGR